MNDYEEWENGAYFFDFYFDRDGYIYQTQGEEGIMLNVVEELYLLHSQYHKKITEAKYVPAGSIIGCTYGSILAKLSAEEATGIYVGNGAPVMTCSDCKSGENIPTFGTCKCPEYMRMELPGRRIGTYGKANAPSGKIYEPTGYKCIPLIKEDWKQPGKNRVLIWRASNGGEYQCALKDNAILVCLYGGTIGIVETDSIKIVSIQEKNKYYVTEKIKVRETPNGKQVDRNKVFKEGAIVEIYQPQEIKNVDDSEYSWIKICYGENKTGWVAKEFLEELPKPITGYRYQYKWEKSQYVTQDFKDKVAGISRELGIDPDDLMAVMAFESRFNPAQKNLAGGSATGLVQFMPTVAEELNTTTSKLAQMEDRKSVV